MTGNSSDHICALLACVETLLARQAEVLDYAKRHPIMDLNVVIAILDPQPAAASAALAKEKTNG